MNLEGNKIQLRALEPEDISFLYQIENDTSVWEVSNTQTPYSKAVLREYLKQAYRDIYEIKQLRLAITNKLNSNCVGFIDLFDFDPKNKRVGVGIVIAEKDRGQGFASEALTMVCDYVKKYLQVHQLYANIGADNKQSIQLFEKNGFKSVGVKKDWIYSAGQFKDEYLYQLILDVY